MAATTRLALPYPVATDPANVPADLLALATLLDSIAAWDAQDVIANRPAAGKRGRYFWATDQSKLYRDTGSAWVDITPTWTRSGTVAARPAANLVPAGSIYYSTDDNGGRVAMAISNAWVNISPSNTINDSSVSAGALSPDRIVGTALTAVLPTYTALTPQGGWVTSTGYSAPRVTRIGKMVYVEGYVGHSANSNPGSGDEIMVTLPSGFRPPRQHLANLYCETSSGQTLGLTLFDPDGTVRARTGGAWNRSIFYSFISA